MQEIKCLTLNSLGRVAVVEAGDELGCFPCEERPDPPGVRRRGWMQTVAAVDLQSRQTFSQFRHCR